MLVVPRIDCRATVTLNIGLGGSIAWGKYKQQNSKHGEVLTFVDRMNAPYKVASIIEQVALLSIDDHVLYRIVQSNTETTVVVKFTADIRTIHGKVFQLSEDLKQDCIAMYVHNDVNGGKGCLLGRYSYVWGVFKDEYFIQLGDTDNDYKTH